MQKVLNDKRYENWKVLDELFMQFYENTAGEI